MLTQKMACLSPGNTTAVRRVIVIVLKLRLTVFNPRKESAITSKGVQVMAIGDISLSASARANLTALQNTSQLLQTTQGHLATGKKVNSASDNATAFFASQGFLSRANSLSNLKDNLLNSPPNCDVDNQTRFANAGIPLLISFRVLPPRRWERRILWLAPVTLRSSMLCSRSLTCSSTTRRSPVFANLLNSTSNNLVVFFNETNRYGQLMTISGLVSTSTSSGLAVAAATNAFSDTASHPAPRDPYS